MPAADADLENDPQLPFPPIKKSHILHCSCHYWYPRFRTLTPKTRLVPLSQAFITYLRADGIVLPPDGESDASEEEFESDLSTLTNQAGTIDLESSDDDAEDSDEEAAADEDPSLQWSEVHSAIKFTITELGGKVVPKLNWSAPKDATWINATNSMECRSPNDVYLLLKSSDFVTHDLEHAFEGCVDDDDDEEEEEEPLLGLSAEGNHQAGATMNDAATPSAMVPKATDIPYTLALRKSFALNPSVEFRCFVRNRHLLAISQRSVNYFDFLFPLVPELRSLITDFFTEKIKISFPDADFAFDVYVPDPYKRVWLIDFNPWAPRTDPLLFSWLELLTMDGPEDLAQDVSGAEADEEEVFQPEFRLIKRDDPEAYSFNTPQYSAHKMPADVVQASHSGPGPLRELAEQWKEALDRGEQRG